MLGTAGLSRGTASGSRRAAERQEQFVYDASHELRTPLSALTAEVDLALRRPRTPEELEAALRRIAADTARLAALAEELLTLGSLSAGTSAQEPVDARALLDAAADRARGQLPREAPRMVLDDMPCRHAEHGTTVSLLLPDGESQARL